jgi:hypothetical protein
MFKNILSLLLGLSVNYITFGTTYYVATTGNNSNTGFIPEKPWKTFTFAASSVLAGDTVFIKAGLYNNERVIIGNSGLKGRPIVFQGYYKRPGDTPNPQYNASDSLNYKLIPVLKGVGGSDVIYIDNKQYFEIRNLGLTGGNNGIFTNNNTSNFIIENLFTKENGWGNSSGGGIYLMGSCQFSIRNCMMTDAGMINLMARQSHDGLIENCISYAVGCKTDAVDYHIALQDAQNITIKNCKAYNLHYLSRTSAGHGIGIKDEYKRGAYHNPHSTGNNIINCSVYDCGEYFFVAHESFGNVFLNCNAYGHYEVEAEWSEGITIRDGAHDNIFRNCRIDNTRTSLVFQNTIEGPLNPDGTAANQSCYKNIITDCTFTNSLTAIEIGNADNNLIDNSVFNAVGKKYFLNFLNPKSEGNIISNSAIINITGIWSADNYNTGSVMFLKNNKFWKNSFPMPAGKGNLTVAPKI